MEKETNVWKKKFRRSKEWKEKREKLIIDKAGKCEWCSSNEFLSPAHQNHMRQIRIKLKDKEFSIYLVISDSQLKTNYYSIFNAYLEQILTKEVPKDYFKRKRDGTKYKSGKLKKEAWKFLHENEEIKTLLYPVVEKFNSYFKEWYVDFNNCLLLCRNCHYAQSKGLLRCKCNKKYYFRRHGSCPDCYSEEKKKGIAKRKKEREREEKEFAEYEAKIDAGVREMMKEHNEGLK